MKITIAALAAVLLTTSSTLAKSSTDIPSGDGPGAVPFGAGTQRGLQELNNSGQNGFVTLFDRGDETAVVVAIEGTKGHAQRAAIVRARSCDALGDVAASLADLHHGISRGFVPMATSRLTSGNYVAVVYSSAKQSAHPVACGQLFN